MLLRFLLVGILAAVLFALPMPLVAQSDCDAAYPDENVCIPAPPPDLDCKDIEYRNFTVLEPDPHRFDGDNDGIGCEQR
ncbi:MAG: hypothetical protein AAF609_24080 [Cyanobacteria bacterium P01_C01_bin.120]